MPEFIYNCGTVVRPTLEEYRDQLIARDRLTPLVSETLGKIATARQQYHTIIYIAGALTEATAEDKERYAMLSKLVGRRKGMFGYAPHINGTDPKQHPDVTPEEVRDIDRAWSVQADIHFNVLQPAALGNGIEEGWAEEHNIPALYLSRSLPSRIVRGMWNIAGTVTYEDFRQDALPRVNDFLDGYETYRARE